MTVRRFLSRAGLAALAAGALTAAAPPAAPTFARDIAPILYQECTVCHRDGEVAPFPLVSYRDAQKRAAQIERMVRARQMPPWLAEEGPHPFAGERRLSSDEIATIAQWVQAGAPEGDPADLPALPDFPTGWWLGEPDLVLTMDQAYEVPAEGRDIYRCFVFPTNLPEDKWVTAVEFHPGNARVVHHGLFFLDGRGRGRRLDARDEAPGYDSYTGPGFLPDSGLGGWAPGAFPKRLPSGTARRLPAGSDVVVQVHFHPTGKPETEQSTIGLYFTDTPPTREIHIAPLGRLMLLIPPGEANFEVKDEFTTPVDIELHGIVPHAHLLGRTVESWATLPDGRRLELLDIPRWDFNWQEQYRYREPVMLPAGTTVSMRWVYDNSAGNPLNPFDPPRTVTFGLGTNDEMCCLWLQIIARDPADLPALREALDRQNRGRVGGEFL